MTNQTPNKEFDCVAMKREAQERIYQEIKDMTPEQEIQYFRDAVEKSEFRDWWKKTIPFSGNRVNRAS
jgi:chemotaxis regulatin CheY-phosphate phosphatase CheZ